MVAIAIITTVIRTHYGPKNEVIPVCLHAVLGSDYSVPP